MAAARTKKKSDAAPHAEPADDTAAAKPLLRKYHECELNKPHVELATLQQGVVCQASTTRSGTCRNASEGERS